MDTLILDHSENAESAIARRKRRVVGIVFILLPFLISFAYGLWSETARPWITPMDLDETLMPLPALTERCIKAVLSGCMLFTMPMLFSGLALHSQRVSISSMVFCAGSLSLFGVMLVGMFLRMSFAPGAPIPEIVLGFRGILLFVCLPTTLLSLLLFTLEKTVCMRIVALLPSIILDGVLLLLGLSSLIR